MFKKLLMTLAVFGLLSGAAQAQYTPPLGSTPGDFTVTGDLTVGQDEIILEGATANAFETTLIVTDPTADRTATFADASGTVFLSTLATNAPSIANSIWGASNAFVFEGATADDFELSLAPADPTADRTVTFADAGGTVFLSSLATNAPDVANSVWGGTNQLLFEGATANDFETILTPTDPTADRTITLPNISGTALVGGGGAFNALTGTWGVDVDNATDQTLLTQTVTAFSIDVDADGGNNAGTITLSADNTGTEITLGDAGIDGGTDAQVEWRGGTGANEMQFHAESGNLWISDDNFRNQINIYADGTNEYVAIDSYGQPTALAGNTSSTVQATSYRYAWAGTTLTEGSPTNVAVLTIADGSAGGGTFEWAAFAEDATDHQVRTGSTFVSFSRKGGTLICGVGDDDVQAVAVSAGTFTCAATCNAAASQLTLRLDCTSSLTQTTLVGDGGFNLHWQRGGVVGTN